MSEENRTENKYRKPEIQQNIPEINYDQMKQTLEDLKKYYKKHPEAINLCSGDKLVSLTEEEIKK